MIEKTIMLSTIESVKEFVKIAANYDCEVDLVLGKYMVDAKSIMGIFSLDLTQPLTLRADCEADDKLAADIMPFIYRG